MTVVRAIGLAVMFSLISGLVMGTAAALVLVILDQVVTAAVQRT
jgi:hypothetical protein